MPPDDKKVNSTADASVINKVVSYQTYITSNRIGSPFITRHAGDPVIPEKPPTPTSESQDPIVGYRVWSLNSYGLLVSSIKPVVWPARQKMQRGTREEQLGLGIHAAKHLDRIFKPLAPDEHDVMALFFEEQGLWDDYRGQVAGEVSLWGEVKEFKYGYTAEFAYPKRLWVPESMDVLKIMQLEKNYGVPVDTRPDLGPWKESALVKMINATWAVPIHFTVSAPPPRQHGRSYFRYDASQNKMVPDNGPRKTDSLDVLTSGKFVSSINSAFSGIIRDMTDEEKKSLDKSKDKV